MSNKQRLSPVSIIFFTYETFKTWLIAIILGFFPLILRIQNGWTKFAIAMGFLALPIILAIVKYFTFNFEINDEGIIVKSGWINVSRKHVPFLKIQNVVTTQPFYVKPFNLIRIQIETSAKQEIPEIVLPVVKQDVLQEIQQHRGQTVVQNGEQKETESENVYRVPTNNIWTYAFTSPGFIAGVAIIWGFVNRIQKSIAKLIKIDTSTISQMHFTTTIIFIAIISLTIIVYFITVLMRVEKNYHFTVIRDKDTLKISSGYLVQRTTSIQMNRIQAVKIERSLVRSFFHLNTIKLVAVASSVSKEGRQEVLALPVIEEGLTNDFLSKFLPDYSVNDFERDLPKQNLFYHFRNTTTLLFPLILLGTSWFKVWGMLLYIVLAVFYIKDFYNYRTDGMLVSGEQLMIQKGSWFSKSIFLIHRNKIQSMKVASSKWLDNKEIASLYVSLRGNNFEYQVPITYIWSKDTESAYQWYFEE